MRPPDGTALRAEVVAVGTELVVGDNVDTNSAWLSQRLVELGVDVRRHTSIGDDLEAMAAALRRATADHDVVIVTGGLGPTHDDLTRFAVAEVAGVELERRGALVDVIRSQFVRRGRPMPAGNLVQADLPVGAAVIAPVGTAAGFVLEVAGALLICLPGVPAEMRQMTERSVLPLLRERGGLATTVHRTVRTAGMAESDVADRCAALAARLGARGNPRLALLASRAETRVRVTARAADREAAHALTDPVVDELIALLGTGVVGVDDEGTEHLVARLLSGRGWTLAVAESITGGGVGARLVTVPGASTWFAGGVIVYATTAKPLLGGVPADLLAEHGPVSEPVVEALARGVRDRLGSDVGLGVVGVAGPTTQGGVDVGTVCLGVALPGGAWTRTVLLPPRSRQELQEFGASTALDYLRRRLADVAG